MKVSLLGELVPVFWWIEKCHISLNGNVISIDVFWGVQQLGMAFDRLTVVGSGLCSCFTGGLS